jgi:hypothetical protein
MPKKKTSGLTASSKLNSTDLKYRTRGAHKYASVIASLEKLVYVGEAVSVDVPEGKDPLRFRNALATSIRRSMPTYSLAFRVLDGNKAVAVILL